LAFRTASSLFRYSNSISRVPSVQKFGGSFAIDLVAFLAARLVKANRVAGIFDFEAGLQAPKALSPLCAVIVSLAGPQRSR
jgi:hypothetical protein